MERTVLVELDAAQQPDGVQRPSGAPQLDAAQQEVLARDPAASFAVIGAPGTGKTVALVEFVADRVGRHGLAPESILVLAPTRQGATRLRDRVALRLGLPSNGPLARTASSAAFEIVRRGARAAGVAEVRPVALLTGAEQDRIVAELLQGGLDDETDRVTGDRAAPPAPVPWPESLPPEVRRLREFRTELRELMMRATENGVSPDALAELGRREGLPEWVAAAAFIREYARTVESYDSTLLDSAELLAEARRLLHAGEVDPVASGRAAGSSSRAGAPLRLVVIDDAHDLPIGALNLVREFARRGVAVVGFGDPDVATAGFRGSDVRGLGQWGRVLGVPVEPPVYLTGSHRQRGALRALTRRVTERIGTAAAGRQRAAGSESAQPASAGAASAGVASDGAATYVGAASAAAPVGAAPRVLRIEADSRAGEVAAIARLLRERHLLDGVDWSRMAVIVRSGALVPAVARGLGLAEVPTRTTSAVQALRDDYAARHLAEGVALAIGRLPLTPEALTRTLLGPLCGVDPVGLRRLRLALRHDELAIDGARHADELLDEAVRRPEVLALIDSAPARRVGALGRTFAALAESHRAGATIEELLWQLWERTGLARRWGELAAGSGIVADEANRNLDGAVALFTAARRAVEREPDRPAELFLDEFLTAEVPEDTLSPRSRSGSVLVTTPTGALGLEVDTVVVAGLQESVWPNLRLRGSLLHAQRLSALASGTLPPEQADDSRAEVLGDELRMFALAVSRSSALTVLSAVANDDEQPSPFLAFAPDAPPYRAPRHPLTLRGLAGQLRRRLSEEGESRAAIALARLAAEGVPGASPAEWYGLLPASTEEPVVDPADEEAVVRVSPSRIEAFEQSPLMWFVDQVAGGSKSIAAGVGTIVHAVMEQVAADPRATAEAEELGVDALGVESLWAAAEERWGELRFEAPWLQEREKRALHTKLEGLSGYLREFARDEGRELLGAEAGFSYRQGRAQVNGSIDRVERTADGGVLVIDLKTGKYPVRKDDMAAHAQMAAYQLAVAQGSVTELAVPGGEPRGAALLYVAKGEAGLDFTLRTQEPLGAEELAAIAARIEAVAEGMAGTRFPGIAEPEERDYQNRYDYRIQLIRAVSE